MSIINPNSINGGFPVFGQDNPTQGFRDNFTNIKNNFVATKAEIEDLQNKVLLKAALNGIDFSNDMNGASLINPQLKAFTQTFLGLGQQFGDVTINFLDGNFQFMETGSDITLTIENWPSTTVTQPAYATLRLWFQVSSTGGTPHTITFPPEVNINSATIMGMDDVTKTVIFPEGGNYIFDLSTVNGGINIFISEVSRNRAGDISVDMISSNDETLTINGSNGDIELNGPGYAHDRGLVWRWGEYFNDGINSSIKQSDDGIYITGYNITDGVQRSFRFDGTAGSLTFPDNSVQTTAWNGTAINSRSITLETSATYYIKEYGDVFINYTQDYGSAIAYDSNGNLHVVGGSYDGNATGIMNIYARDGELLSQLSIVDADGENPFLSCEAIWIDANDNRYVLMVNDTTNTGYVVKYSSTGVQQWLNTIDLYTGNREISDICGDNNGHIYIVGDRDMGSGVNSIFVIQFSTTGDVNWQRQIMDTYSLNGLAIDADPTGVYITGNWDNTNGYTVKLPYDGDGYIWQNTIPGPTTLFGLVLDHAKDFLYTAGYADNGCIIVKYNAYTGSLIWYTTIDIPTGGGSIVYDITIDQAGDLYVSGQTSETGETNIFIAKLNSSGAVVWQRTFGSPYDASYQWLYYGHREIAVYNQTYAITGYTYIAPDGDSLSQSDMFIVQMPIDGSQTGTYTGFNYLPADNPVHFGTDLPTTSQGFSVSDPEYPIGSATLTITNNELSDSTVSINTVTRDWTFGTDGSLTTPHSTQFPGKVTDPGLSTINGNYSGAPVIDITSSIVYLRAITESNASYLLPSGLYDGQTITFLPAMIDGIGNNDIANIFVYGDYYNISLVDSNVPWYLFSNYMTSSNIGTPQAIWSERYQCWYPQPWNFD